ncbi:hypothetical protein BDZ94DRAFT_652493 [Collybia nuda]|uniref:Uncharacterized protein n=1 Tax=Collybia nuda TaxID=64659 RepID=A0A9P5Y8G4_9AGAR|nr:hypothetical protein BDZ94DRAFT_652493 [Collybia nuda]
MMVLEDWRDQIRQNSPEDIGADILEFCGHDTYPEDVEIYILEMILVLIGSRRSGILIDCVSTWPLAGIRSFIPWLAKVLNPLWLSHPGTTGYFPLSLALGYHISFSTNRPYECIILFMIDLSDNLVRQTAYQNTEQRSNNAEELSFHTMWPQLPFSPFSNILFQPRAERRVFWRSTKPEIVDLRLSALLGLVRMTRSPSILNSSLILLATRWNFSGMTNTAN